MSQFDPQFLSDGPNTSDMAIHGIRERLFMLAIIEDEDDAATLRVDIKRSRLNEYKLQRCVSLDEARGMLRACGFDLLFIDIDAFEDPSAAIERLQETGYDNPILGLISRRSLQEKGFATPLGVDDLICKEDFSPSLVEQAIRSILARNELAALHSLQETRLHLALELGELGAWSYFTKERRLEMDEIAKAMLFCEKPGSALNLEELIELVYPEDRAKVSEALEQLPLDREIADCQFRVNGDRVPLRSLEIRGRIWRDTPSSPPSIVGFIKRSSQTNELFQRIAEANTEIQEAFRAKEETIRKANQKLQALASEIETAQETGPEKAASKSFIPMGLQNLDSRQTENPTKDQATRRPAVKKVLPPEAPQFAPTATSENEKEKLSINTQTACRDVIESAGFKKKTPPKQESFLFDFAKESASDLRPLNPEKDGFIEAAKRHVDIVKQEYKLDASFSYSDEQSIELEQKKSLLFDILRELISNVAKHAHATLCIVTLFRDEDEWVLQVEDDGVGLNDPLKSVNTPLNKIGLFQIRSQLALEGGHLDMAPASPKGLVARARLPVSIGSGAKSN